MTEKFTPGEWRYCAGASGKGPCKCGNIMNEDAHIAEVFGPYHLSDGIEGPDTVPNWEQQQANIHLIAAAPDLYDALSYLLSEYEDHEYGDSDIAAMAVDALAKARGET